MSVDPCPVPLEQIGGTAELLQSLAAPGGRPARVLRVDRDRVLVTDGHVVTRTDPEQSTIDDPDTGERVLPAVGDWLRLSPDEPPAVVAVRPRYGRVVRRNPGEPRPQILATGVDVVVITVPLDRPRNIARLEREVVTAYAAGATAMVALTKADLVGDPGAEAAALRTVLSDIDVVAVRAIDGDEDPGTRALAASVAAAGTGVLLGPSGAGKSTLVNAIVGRAVRSVGVVREADRRGRHTTATRELVALPGGGALIDMPGLRALGLWDAAAGLQRAFPEITELAAACRFADCTHSHEPGCAVRATVTDGGVDPGRLRRYLGLADELAEAEQEWEVAQRLRRRRVDRRAR